jgi:hypothetical protein
MEVMEASLEAVEKSTMESHELFNAVIWTCKRFQTRALRNANREPYSMRVVP